MNAIFFRARFGFKKQDILLLLYFPTPLLWRTGFVYVFCFLLSLLPHYHFLLVVHFSFSTFFSVWYYDLGWRGIVILQTLSHESGGGLLLHSLFVY